MKSKQVAIIGCEPLNQPNFREGKANTTGRGILAKRVLAFKGFHPKVHWPIKDPKDLPTHKDCDGIIFSGSATNLTDDGQPTGSIKRILDFIRETHGKIPMLGICFGHQAIAMAFGSEVVRFMPDPGQGAELGFAPIKLTSEGKKDVLLQGLGDNPQALFAHLCYVKTIPEDGEILASGISTPIQGLKIGEATYGVQFHPEYTGDTVRQILLLYKDFLSRILSRDTRIVLRIDERTDDKVLENFLNIL